MHFFNALSDSSRDDFRSFMAQDSNLLEGWRGGPFETLLRYNFSGPVTGSWNGDDISDLYRSPVEMGWGRNIALDHEFIGRAALEQELAKPRRKVVTLEFAQEDVLRIHASLFGSGPAYRQFELPDSPYQVAWTDLILKDGKTVGHATRPGYSLFFRKVLALSFIDMEFSQPGTEVSVLWGNPSEPQTTLRATVAPAPYKKDERRKDLSKV
jgi:vanillate/3-O-methylgallate O-demethylase